MRLSTAFVALLSVGISPAKGLSLWGGDHQTLVVDDGNKVPGESPLELCPGASEENILTIKRVDLLPNPPEAGKELVIEASGIVSETIEAGAYINLTVKYGLIRLITTRADLCEEIKNVDLECPIEKGLLSVTKSVEMPAQIPPGKYTVLADVYTKDDVPITCLTATVVFSISSGSESGSLFDMDL